MPFTVPKLKYTHDALEPYLSEDVIHYHYGKHTKKYFDQLNDLIKGTYFDKYETLDELVSKKSMMSASHALYNNAMQAWNHSFYWDCLAPKSEAGKPNDELKALIEKEYKSCDGLVEKFNEKAAKHFGSGWCWLTVNGDGLSIIDTHDAENLFMLNRGTPILTIDVWEHAYYLDYANDRAKYLDKVWNIVNWEFVNEQYGRTRTTDDKGKEETRSS